jgi:hypothetical protein
MKMLLLAGAIACCALFNASAHASPAGVMATGPEAVQIGAVQKVGWFWYFDRHHHRHRRWRR